MSKSREDRKKEKAKRAKEYAKRMKGFIKQKKHGEINSEAMRLVQEGLMVIEGEPPNDVWKLKPSGVYYSTELKRFEAGHRTTRPTYEEARLAEKAGFATVEYEEARLAEKAGFVVPKDKQTVTNQLSGSHWAKISTKGSSNDGT